MVTHIVILTVVTVIISKFYKSTMVAVASMTELHHPTSSILPNNNSKYYKTKLESVSLSRKSHHSKTANIKILSANSMHREKLASHLWVNKCDRYRLCVEFAEKF